MGKNKVTTKVEEAKAVESVTKTEAAAEVSKKPGKKQVLNGVAHVNVSYNNTLIAISDLKGDVISWSSAGLLGFKGTKKSTPYVANLVAKDCVEKAKKFNLNSIKIVVKGIGPGRESAIRGLAGTGMNISSIMDSTPIAHNGVRRKKPRRV